MIFEVTFIYPKPSTNPSLVSEDESVSKTMSYLPKVGDYISFENDGKRKIISITHNVCKAHTNDTRNFVTIQLGK